MRGWRRPDWDKVTAAVAVEVFRRDRMCFLYRLDHRHLCCDQLGRLHSPFEMGRMTLDHVHEKPPIGESTSYADDRRGAKRAPSDPAHLVAMCAAGNVGCPSAEVRDRERDWLADHYPEVWGDRQREAA